MDQHDGTPGTPGTASGTDEGPGRGTGHGTGTGRTRTTGPGTAAGTAAAPGTGTGTGARADGGTKADGGKAAGGKADGGTGGGARTDEAPLLTIGAFAARARLSAKALRLYDRLGLLTPDHVDTVSGYRYYRADQVEQARTVVLLRRLDMPLAEIGEVLRGDGARAAGRLAAYWKGVEERVAAQRTLVDHLHRRLTGRNTAVNQHFEIRTTDVPEQFVLTQSRHTLAHELPAWIGASFDRLTAGARECGGITGAPFVVYHAEVTQESDGPAESCVPVRDARAARAWALAQGRSAATGARPEPAHRIAYTRITRAQVAYPQIITAYEAVEEWIARQGLRIAGPCREIYFNEAEWDAAPPHEEVCDIAFPVTGS